MEKKAVFTECDKKEATGTFISNNLSAHWLKEQELYVLSDKQMEEVSNYFVNKLIDILPTGDISAFDLIKAINNWVGNQSLYIASLNLK